MYMQTLIFDQVKMTLTILEQTNQHLVDLEVIIHVSIVNVCNLSTISVSHHRNM